MGADETQIEASLCEAINTAKKQNSISLATRAEATYAEYRKQKASVSGGKWIPTTSLLTPKGKFPTQTVNLQDLWRESLHGIWRIFHLPEEGKGAVRRSSRDDFELYRLGPRRNCWRQGHIFNLPDHAKCRAKKYVR